MTPPSTSRTGSPPAQHPQVSAWATTIEAGVLARAALRDPDVAWRGDATSAELAALVEAGAAAQQEFVMANLGLIGHVVSGQGRGGLTGADLFQDGCLGLIAAIERFDHRRGVRFSTYATYWIRAYVAAGASRHLGAVTVPVGRADQQRAAYGVQGALAQQLGRLPSTAEVAAALGRDERWTAGLLGQRAARSLDDLDEWTLHRLAHAGGQPDDATREEVEVWAHRLLSTLGGFERRVLELRLGFGGRPPDSLAAVARELGVPVGRVRRAEARAIELLRGRCPREVLAGLAS